MQKINLEMIEKNSYLEHRIKLFTLLEVPKHQIPGMCLKNEYIISDERIVIAPTIRPFYTLPKWLKKRMKYRLRHTSQFEAKSFQEAKGDRAIEKLNNMQMTFNTYVENLIN